MPKEQGTRVDTRYYIDAVFSNYPVLAQVEIVAVLPENPKDLVYVQAG